MEMTVREWIEKYKPFTTENGQIYAFETYSDLSRYDKNQIWTSMEVNEEDLEGWENKGKEWGEGDMVLVITSGWHWCNRLNYFITEIPHTGEFINVIVSEEDEIYYGI
jgi:hypothetical protein